MRRVRLSIAALLCLFVLSGCYRTLYHGPDLSFPAAMQKPAQGEVVVDHFRARLWNHHFVYGLFPTSTPDMNRILEKHVPPGHEVRNLTIRHEYSFLNGLVAYIASSMYTPWTTTITGDVVKLNGGAI